MNRSWKQSVEIARAASLKTFEGRLAIARASLEQIPANGKGAKGTLADFAEETGVEYNTLRNYRAFTEWWGDCTPTGAISYTVAREAQAADKWATGQKLLDFVNYCEADDMPVYTDPSGEYEPYQFTTWTMNALRVYLGRPPNNNLKLTLKEKAGEVVTEDDLHDAAAGDAMEVVATETEQISEPKKKRTRATKVLTEALAITATTHDGPVVVQPALAELRSLPGHITDAKLELIALIEQSERFLAVHGKEQFSLDGETHTGADILVRTVQQTKGDVSGACDQVTGDLDAALAEILST